MRVYLGVKTCEVFLCLVAIVKVRPMLTPLFSFFYVTTSLVSVTGFYTEDEAKMPCLNRDKTSPACYS